MGRKATYQAKIAEFERMADASEPGIIRDTLNSTAKHWRERLILAEWRERNQPPITPE